MQEQTAGDHKRDSAGSWIICTVVAAILFVAVAATTTGTFRLFAFQPVGVFYDYQARSLIEGRLDVPDEAIGDEAFMVNGKTYGYFGPAPAVLRMPLAAAGVPPGVLARIFMVLYVGGALVAGLLLWFEARQFAGLDPRTDRWSPAVLLLNVGLGSTLLFLAGRAMMYHEAIAAGAAFALWSTWLSLRQLRRPDSRAWVGALIFGVLAIQSRPPSGLFALTLLGTVILMQLKAGWQRDGAARNGPRWRALGVVAASALGVFSFHGVAYLKFGTFDGAPLQLSRPYTPERLARIEGRSFHVENVPWGFYSYFVRANARLEPQFPYLFMRARQPPRTFPHAKIDLPDHTLAIPWSMPGLFLLGVLMAGVGFWTVPRLRAPVAALWLAATPMMLAMFAAIAIAHRYTADFCPVLVASSAFGLATIEGWQGWRRGSGRLAISVATAAAIFVNIALTFDYQANWGPRMPEEVKSRYSTFAAHIDRVFRLR